MLPAVAAGTDTDLSMDRVGLPASGNCAGAFSLPERNPAARWAVGRTPTLGRQGGANCSPACGALSAASPPAGATAAVKYTAPATLPANHAVTVKAQSVADVTKISSASITIASGTVELVPASLNFGAISPLKNTTRVRPR